MKTPSVYVPGPAVYPRVFAYHEISAQFQLGVTCVHPARFQKHLQFLREAGLSITPLRGLQEQSPTQSVCLTFDDGYLSFYQDVFPSLIQGRLPATLFIITDFVGRTNDWDVTLGINRRRHLDWAHIREISTAGIEIGSHTRTHRDLATLSSADLHWELEISRKTLEDQIGKPVTALALPFGAVNVRVFTCARELNYREICGGAPGFHGPFPGVLPRMPVYRWDGRKALQRKLDFQLGECLRLQAWQTCSRLTRVFKNPTPAIERRKSN